MILGRVQCKGLLTAVEEKIRFEDSDNTMINVNLGSGLFKKSVFEKVGYFDETLRYCEDHDWFLRAREHSISMIILKQVTLYYRIHGNSMSWKKQKTDPTMMQILKMSLERRRKQHNGSAPPLKKFFDYDEGRV